LASSLCARRSDRGELADWAFALFALADDSDTVRAGSSGCSRARQIEERANEAQAVAHLVEGGRAATGVLRPLPNAVGDLEALRRRRLNPSTDARRT